MQKPLGLRDVTFGITSFERPHLLKRLVHSILRIYPHADIVVADNGRRKAVLPEQVRVLDLPFDCGLSASRNALVRATRGPLMLLLEEDFYFLPTTRIEGLLDVLNHDAEVGVVGGAMLGPMGDVISYSMDIEVFRKTLSVRETNHRQHFTRAGSQYRICDLIWNFALFRSEMLRDHPWDEALKVGEHTPYFYEVKKAAKWRVACCPEAVIYHVPDRRSPLYRAHRQRARDLFQGYLRRNGFDKYQRISQPNIDQKLCDKPSVVVLGVGHSGTSILTRMLHRAGWQAGDADDTYAESVSIRSMNEKAMESGGLPAAAQHWLRRFPQPWAIKDPRFAWTLHRWLLPFSHLAQPPVLVRIQREPEAVARSYRRRGVERSDLESMVREREERCAWQYRKWPWEKMTIDFERLGSAVSLFQTLRMDSSQPLAPRTSRNWALDLEALEASSSSGETTAGNGLDADSSMHPMVSIDGSPGWISPVWATDDALDGISAADGSSIEPVPDPSWETALEWDVADGSSIEPPAPDW